MPRPRPLRAGIVGLDHYHVTGWAETFLEVPGTVTIVALCDADPDARRRLAPRWVDPSLAAALPALLRDLPVEADLDALLARHDLDIALVTLPNRDAPAAIARCAAAGVHVLVDKPAARSAAELAPALAAARSRGVHVAVGLNRRHAAAWQHARTLVADGRLGPIVSAEAVFAASGVAVRGPANPIFDADGMGGGILSWLGVHDLDALLWLTGETVVEVSAMAARTGVPGLAVENAISVALRLSGGGIATMHDAYALPARGYRTWFALRGTEASLEIGMDGALTLLAPDPDGPFLTAERIERPDPPAGGYGWGGRRAIEDLADAIDESRDPLASGDHVLAALRVIDAAYRSAREGRVIPVG